MYAHSALALSVSLKWAGRQHRSEPSVHSLSARKSIMDRPTPLWPVFHMHSWRAHTHTVSHPLAGGENKAMLGCGGRGEEVTLGSNFLGWNKADGFKQRFNYFWRVFSYMLQCFCWFTSYCCSTQFQFSVLFFEPPTRGSGISCCHI